MARTKLNAKKRILSREAFLQRYGKDQQAQIRHTLCCETVPSLHTPKHQIAQLKLRKSMRWEKARSLGAYNQCHQYPVFYKQKRKLQIKELALIKRRRWRCVRGLNHKITLFNPTPQLSVGCDGRERPTEQSEAEIELLKKRTWKDAHNHNIMRPNPLPVYM